MFRTKAQARRELEARRRALSAEEVVQKGREAQSHLASLSFFQSARVVGLYAAQPFEVPTSTLATLVRARGGVVCYPKVSPSDRVLTFHAVAADADLSPAGFGILEPPAAAAVTPLEELDVIVVPGVGFTRTGVRLGRGGGHYDATLSQARFRGISVGLSFANCIVSELPIEEHDRTVSWVVCENEAVST